MGLIIEMERAVERAEELARTAEERLATAEEMMYRIDGL
jgi:hypothetical protein